MALFDQTVDDTMDLSDVMFAGLELDQFASDTISIDPDAIALAASYQYNLQDLIVLADSTFVEVNREIVVSNSIAITEQLLVETAFNTDTIDITDTAVPHLTKGVLVSDSIATTDLAVTGYVRWATISDAIVATDLLSRQIDYNREASDVLVTSDVAHTWMFDDGALEVDFEGNSDLRAVLMKKVAPGIPVGAPPRVVMLPKPPKVTIEHNVVDPNPPRREER